LVLGSLRIELWHFLVTVAILIGHFGIVRVAGRRGLDTLVAAEMSLSAIGAGLVGAHVFKFAYRPDLLAEGVTVIVRRSAGIASFGGILGGLLAAFVYLRVRRQPIACYLDVIAFVFPFAWIFGRSGCAVSHDHPGAPSASWLAVGFPHGSRYDLGLLEVFFTLAVAALFLLLARRQRPAGFWLGLLLSLYGPFRLLLDQLHVDPPRYFGVTVDQYAASLATALGIATLAFLSNSPHNGAWPGDQAE